MLLIILTKYLQNQSWSAKHTQSKIPAQLPPFWMGSEEAGFELFPVHAHGYGRGYPVGEEGGAAFLGLARPPRNHFERPTR